MGKQAAIQARNRAQNSGGVMPSVIKTVVSLAIAFRILSKKAFVSRNGSHRTLLLFLYLWLTGQLEEIDHVADIPDLQRVNKSAACMPHCLRNYREGNTSWSEYAQPYHTTQGVVYLWQPIPTVLQPFFRDEISKFSYNTAFLTGSEKKRFYDLLQTRWKTPLSLRGYHRNRRDVFFRYFTYCVQVDSELSSLSKMVLLGANYLHHKSAIAYQAEESDRLRKKIFIAQNRYLHRLMVAINMSSLSAEFSFLIQHTGRNLTAPLIPEANYLKNSGVIAAYQCENSATEPDRAIPSFMIGSKRGLAVHHVIRFFNDLQEMVDQHAGTSPHTLEQLRQYYNQLTYQLTFEFILLTSTRPTHSITAEQRRYYAGMQVCVRDKGLWRPIYVCTHLKGRIAYYQQLQQTLLLHFPHHQTTQAMWYLIDENGGQELLNARTLRLKMHQLWPGVVPYQLRHVFAQCALTSQPPYHLPPHQIDRLMGHSNFGEHLGSDNQFPISSKPLQAYLESLPQRFGLQGVKNG